MKVLLAVLAVALLARAAELEAYNNRISLGTSANDKEERPIPLFKAIDDATGVGATVTLTFVEGFNAADSLATISLTQVNAQNPFECTDNAVVFTDGSATIGVVEYEGKHFFHVCFQRAENDEVEEYFHFTASVTVDEVVFESDQRIFVHAGCSELTDEGSTHAPPIVTFAYDTEESAPSFTVSAPYTNDGTFVIVNFYSWTESVLGDADHTCQSHVAFSKSQEDLDFDLAAPYATFPNALNDERFPTHYVEVEAEEGEEAPETLWGYVDDGCDRVTYSLVIPFQDLNHKCKNGAGGDGAIETLDDPLRVLGELTVTYVKRIEGTSEFATTEFVYPFSYQIQQNVAEFSSFAERYEFDAIITSLYTERNFGAGEDAPDGKMHIGMRTVVFRDGDTTTSLATPVVGTPGDHVAVITAPDPCDANGPCVQDWVFEFAEIAPAPETNPLDTAFVNQYNGKYTFTWDVSGTDDKVHVEFTINMKVAALTEEVSGLNNADSYIHFFNTLASAQSTAEEPPATSTFSYQDDIFVRHSIDLSDSFFKIVLRKVVMCYSDFPDFVPTSCTPLVGVMPASQVLTLYDEGGVFTGPSITGEEWVLTVLTSEDMGVVSFTALRFKAAAIAVQTQRSYYFEVESEMVSSDGDRRDVRTFATARDVVTKQNMRGITVSSRNSEGNTGAEHDGATIVIVSGGSDSNPVMYMGVGALLVIAGVGAGLISRRNSNSSNYDKVLVEEEQMEVLEPETA